MAGDYTRVPLRNGDRWTAARMQQGRVLLDHDWNLNIDAAARAVRQAARDAIGWAGVVSGSTAFQIGLTPTGPLDLTVDAGVMWVDGLAAYAPAPFRYSDQGTDPLPASGTVLVYLDVFEEEVQPAEDPGDLIDPALGTIDTTVFTRVGYRVRVEPTSATTCAAAWAGLVTHSVSTGRLTVARTATLTPGDPCSPPGDPLAQVPDGLFRVEVLDGGTEANARFAWSYEDGANAVAILAIQGNEVDLAPSHMHFAEGDLVEVSWLNRRADRIAHGALYTASPRASAGGDTLVLDRPPTVPAGAAGLCARRWDGHVVGAAGATNAGWRRTDLGIQFTAAPGVYEAGDWWGARLRAEQGDGIGHLTAAEPDGTRHAYAPLAIVDLGARTTSSDCRPRFASLVDLDFERGACPVSVKPTDDLQAAIDSLPAGGGEVCLAAGIYVLASPIVVQRRQHVVINGAGAASVIRAPTSEAALVFQACQDIEVRNIRIEGGSAPPGQADPNLEGAVMFLACQDVVVQECSLACPDQGARSQTCITVRSDRADPPADGIRIERNRLEVGAWQTGILIVGSGASVVADNRIRLAPGRPVTGHPVLGHPVIANHPTLGADLARRLLAGMSAKSGAGVARVAVPGAEKPLLVRKGSDAEVIARDFARLTSAGRVRRAGGPEKAVLAFAKAVGQGKSLDKASADHLALVMRLVAASRVVGQGIVVAGSRLGTARIEGNLVEDATQGIHVGVSDAGAPGREVADTVVIARNVIHALVPADYAHDRHAVFVGNARTIHVLDTVATLRRLNALVDHIPTPVEGIRIHGQLGPFLAVRQSSLLGFVTGVAVTPLVPVPRTQMWLVADTFAASSAAPVVAPPAVIQERNVH